MKDEGEGEGGGGQGALKATAARRKQGGRRDGFTTERETIGKDPSCSVEMERSQLPRVTQLCVCIPCIFCRSLDPSPFLLRVIFAPFLSPLLLYTSSLYSSNRSTTQKQRWINSNHGALHSSPPPSMTMERILPQVCFLSLSSLQLAPTDSNHLAPTQTYAGPPGSDMNKFQSVLLSPSLPPLLALTPHARAQRSLVNNSTHPLFINRNRFFPLLLFR